MAVKRVFSWRAIKPTFIRPMSSKMQTAASSSRTRAVGYMICCPTSKVAKPHVLGGIYRIGKTGTESTPDPRGLELDWENPQVSWLSDNRPAVVRRAISELAKPSHLVSLQSAEAALPALWSLHRIRGESA